MSVTVISGFPGVGKTKAFEYLTEKGVPILDSDSSLFDKSKFPANYIQHIKETVAKNEVKVIFISSHKEVRDALQVAGIKYIMVFPNVKLKREYMRRYTERGSSPDFISLLDANWESWISELQVDVQRNKVTTLELEENNETMLEVLKELKIV